jgi:hypothetical protein
MDPSPQIDLSTPRTVGQILDAAFRIYARRPLLFMCLAGIVLVPYGAVFLLVSSSKHVSAATEFILALADLALVNPFIAALEMQALIDLGDGRRPEIPDVISRGVKVLAVVAAADIVAGLCEFVGLLFFLVPGLLAAVRLAVAAPVAATERVSWPEAIRRSLQLTRGNFWRVLGLLAIQAVLTYLVALIIGGSSVAGVIVGAVLAILAQSFCTLLINLLYFDLRARETAPVAWQ